MSRWIDFLGRPGRGLALTLGAGLMLGVVHGENIVFPADAGVVDVSAPPYNARGDGTKDCTAAIQQALQDHPDGNWIIYLPNGTYRISTSLSWPHPIKTGQSPQRATILQGQSRAGTRLQLTDYAAGFGTVGRPQPLLWLGDGLTTHERNAVRNLTLHTGAGNPGAVGIQLNTSEQGCLRDVTVIAGGVGGGVAGIDAAHADKIGPCLLKNVRVEGFEVGLRAAFTMNSLTLEHVEFVGQKSAGIRNRGQVISIRDLRSTNEVTAIDNRDNVGMVTVVDSVLHAVPSKRQGPAIYNAGLLLARNVQTPGYTNAIENRVLDQPGMAGPEVREFLSHAPFNLFSAPPHTLGLEVRETPEVPWDPPSEWVSPLRFGGRPDDGRDDSAALQQAIDSGATTVYLPHGSWHLTAPVTIRGKVRRLIGCEADISVLGAIGAPGLVIEEGDSKPFLVERLSVRSPQSVLLETRCRRDVVVSSCLGVRAVLGGGGDVFVEDVSSARSWTIRTNRVWARQWNFVGEGEKLHNEGGRLWVLGMRAERTGTLINTLGGGRSELLGGLCVSSSGFKLEPMFNLSDASGSFSVAEASVGGDPFSTIVTETRGPRLRRLTTRGLGPEAQLPGRVGGISLPLYTGFEGPGAQPPRGDADSKGGASPGAKPEAGGGK